MNLENLEHIMFILFILWVDRGTNQARKILPFRIDGHPSEP